MQRPIFSRLCKGALGSKCAKPFPGYSQLPQTLRRIDWTRPGVHLRLVSLNVSWGFGRAVHSACTFWGWHAVDAPSFRLCL